MISIITPFFNAQDYLRESILSVLAQSHEDWELLLVNDGSTDNSEGIVNSISDTRIRYFEQTNKGVSAARNYGLTQIRGDFFCFLDADDALPTNSLKSRLEIFKKFPNVSFVDGQVKRYDSQLKSIESIWMPDFKGKPLEELVSLSGKAFFGPTWMIKKEFGKTYKLKDGQSHGEDLLFYMELARDGGSYDFTPDVILHYRNTPGSAMKNLSGLEDGYRMIEKEILQWPELSKDVFKTYSFRYRKFMFLAYLKKGSFGKAIKTWLS